MDGLNLLMDGFNFLMDVDGWLEKRNLPMNMLMDADGWLENSKDVISLIGLDRLPVFT